MKEFKNETERHRQWREHLSESHIGLVSPNKDKKFTIEHRANLSKSHKGLETWNKGGHISEDQRSKLKLAWVERKVKFPITDETREKLTNHMNKQWAFATDEQKERRLCNWMKANPHYPTKNEKYLNSILQKHFPNEWKYVGNGDFILGGKNPDFMNCNGKKLLIEMFENWHFGRLKIDQSRLDHFAKYGFKTLIVRENELRHSDLIVEKVSDFMLNSMNHKHELRAGE